MMEDHDYVYDSVTELPTELLKNPYQFICNYYENMYPHMGRKVFSILALVPVSLFLPKLASGDKKVKSKINFLLLSNPGTGKSSLAEEFEKITYQPLPMEYVTDARLFYELNHKDKVSIIVSDIARIFSNPVLTKQLENVLGDEGCISRNTMKNKEEETKKIIDAVAYLSGTPENISNSVIRDGILFRTSPLIVFHTEKEHEQILDSVNDKMGTEDVTHRVNYIPFFYQELYKIQKGEHDTFNPIEGFLIPEEIKTEIKNFIKPLVKPGFMKYGMTSVRELQECYRFLVAHTFLNVYSREIQNGKLIVTKADLEVAKFLTRREIETKTKILSCINAIDQYNLKTVNDLREWARIKKLQEGREIGKTATTFMAQVLASRR